jgi:DNA-binding response OmpR family regulator
MTKNIAIIDDENFYHELWALFLSKEDAELFLFHDPDQFIDSYIHSLNKFDYIIVDIMYGNNNILSTNFSQILREHNYTNEIILYSSYKQDSMELSRCHSYDLFLLKDRSYTLQEITHFLHLNRIHWKNRLNT